jgi:hypothetical protein
VTPEDLAAVAASWADLCEHRVPLLATLTAHFETLGSEVVCSTMEPASRARWLLVAVEQLVGLLVAPSLLADAARDVGASWPDRLTAPSFRVEGRAWLTAGRQCLPTWSPRTEQAWRHAWLLLSEVLAAETLSPFTD